MKKVVLCCNEYYVYSFIFGLVWFGLCACVRACVRACVCACVCVCLRYRWYFVSTKLNRFAFKSKIASTENYIIQRIRHVMR